MKTRYIFSMGEIKRKDNSIAFKNEKGWSYIPIEGVREIYFFNEVSLNSKFLDFLAKAGVVAHFFNYYGGYSGSFYPKEYLISGKLTILQSLAYVEKRLIIAKAIVKAIALNIHEVLYHYYRHGKKELKGYLEWLKTEVPKMLELDIDIKQVLFIEGQIWSRFYDSFKHFLPEDFLMNKRVKRPPDNPMNALISLDGVIAPLKTLF